MVGWDGCMVDPETGRPCGIHPLASVGGPPEHREWKAGDPCQAPHIAATALIHAFCTVDAGMPGLPATTVGDRSWLQARVHLGHNVVVGADCEICAGVVVCGEVTVGDGARIGGNTWIKPRVKIGEGAIIGGGSVVTKDVPAHEVWAGNPARYMKNAWTHPDWRGFQGREQVRDHYAMTESEWDAARQAALVHAPHPYQEAEETWAHMRPWHHRANRA